MQGLNRYNGGKDGNEQFVMHNRVEASEFGIRWRIFPLFDKAEI